MTGDQADVVGRLKAVLPAGWFGDTTPILDAALVGLSAAWSGLYGLVRIVQAQSRIRTASGGFLDLIAMDYFAASLVRSPSEADTPFQGRIQRAILRPRGTRQAVIAILEDLTGRAPLIFEPARSSDTGGYSTGAMGYGVAGAYGSLSLPYQFFVTAYRPLGVGIPLVAGYGSPGPLVYASTDWIGTHITDANIFATVAEVLPVAMTAWTRIV